jgi:hypothetical protein
MVFNRAQSNTYMQVIFMMTHWIRTCLLLDKENELREKLKTAPYPPSAGDGDHGDLWLEVP